MSAIQGLLLENQALVFESQGLNGNILSVQSCFYLRITAFTNRFRMEIISYPRSFFSFITGLGSIKREDCDSS